MAQDTIDIARFAVETADNIAKLKDNIKNLKLMLDDTTLSWEDQQKVVAELQTNQAALRNAMHGTTASLEEVTKAARAADVEFDEQNNLIKKETISYNELVKKMADLTQEFRAATSNADRTRLAAQIKSINSELKELDSSRGIFGRNVGDYFNQMSSAMKDVIKDLPSGLGKIKQGADDLNKSIGLIGKQPIIGMIALLAPLINNIVSALKDNETALNAVDKVLAALKPVADFFAGIIEKIAGWLATAVDWVLNLAKESGVSFNKIVAGAVGVGNALKEFLLVPIRNVITGAKGLGNVIQDIFTGQFKKAAQDAKQAIQDIGDNFKKGFSFKENFAAGQEAGLTFVSGLKSPKVKKEAANAGKEVMKAFRQEFDPLPQIASDLQAAAVGMETAQQALDKAVLSHVEKRMKANREEYEQSVELNKARIEAAFGYANAVSSVLGSLADMYEANGEADEKSAKKAKALRTAEAIISTISGAISAYMNTIESIKFPAVAIPLAAVNAAAVLAAGMANVKKIQSTKVGSGGGDTSTPAITTAPAYAPAISMTRSVTGRSEVERLNRMASDSRVYLVYSDLEIANTRQRVRVQETEF